jgi:hypothetical protein
MPYCRKCQQYVDSIEGNCPTCGASLNPSSPRILSEAELKKHKLKIALAVSIPCLAFLLLTYYPAIYLLVHNSLYWSIYLYILIIPICALLGYSVYIRKKRLIIISAVLVGLYFSTFIWAWLFWAAVIWNVLTSLT